MILSLSELIIALKHTKPGAKVQNFRVTGVRFDRDNAFCQAFRADKGLSLKCVKQNPLPGLDVGLREGVWLARLSDQDNL